MTLELPFRISPLSNVAPFTYRDAVTQQEILERLANYVETGFYNEIKAEIQRIIDDFNKGLSTVDEMLAAFNTEIDRRIMQISNRVGPEGIQRRTLTANTAVLIDPAWPDAHPIRFQFTQDATGGHTVTLGDTITDAGQLVINPAAGSTTEFYLYPLGDGTWEARTDDSVTADLVHAENSETRLELAAHFLQRIEPTTVYVNPVTGDDTRTGLTTGDALRTVSEAIRRAEHDAGSADTAWVVNLANGVYTERVTASAFTPFAINLTIQGAEIAHPATPLAVFTEGVGASAAAMKFENPRLDVTVKYVKFTGYNGTSSSAGINSSQGRLYTVNVHAEQCFYGVSSVRGQLDVKGGVFTNNGRLANGTGNGAGIRSLMLNRHSIGTQGAGNLGLGPVFTGNRYGVFAQENSTGHIDWCTFNDNESAIVLRSNARGNLDGCAFARNLTDIFADSNAHAFIPSNVVFGAGADKSNQTTYFTGGARATTGRAINGVEMAYARGCDAVYGVYDVQDVTGTAFVLDRTLGAQWWNDSIRSSGTAPKRLKVRAVGTLTGVTDVTRLILRLGTKTSTITFSATETGTFVYESEILFVSPTRQIITSEAYRHLSDNVRNVVSTTNQDMSTETRLTLEASVTAGDTVSLEYVELSAG